MEGKKNTKKKCRWSKDDTELTLLTANAIVRKVDRESAMI